MKYNIISINDERKFYKDKIRKNVHLEEVGIPSIDAFKIHPEIALNQRGLELTDWAPKVGEFGVWMSQFDCWKWAVDNDESLLVFEDDAIVGTTFTSNFERLLTELPKDYDFFSLWVPENQMADFCYDVTYDDNGIPSIVGSVDPVNSCFEFGSPSLAKVYQGYGMVATLYSPKGAEKLIEEAVNGRGIYTPVDCFIFQEAHGGRVNGYAPKPFRNVVSYDWSAKTTIHETGII